MRGLKILIAGGRGFSSALDMWEVLEDYEKSCTTVISGCARGADSIGEDWAKAFNIPVERYPALWDEHGRAAGHIRNQLMLDDGKPDLVVVFPGGKGSESMVKKARKAGVEVLTPGWEVP